MTGRHHLKSLVLVTLGVLLLSAAGLSACAQPAAPTPPTTPAPAAIEEKTPPPVEKAVTEEKPPAPSGSTTTPTGGTTAPPGGTASPPGGTTTPPPQQTPTALTVDISGFAFAPATITVPVGTTITWTNKDSVPHTVSSRSGLFDSGNLPTGATFSYTFREKGTFDYYCKIHPSITGKVIVGEGGTAPTGGNTTATQGTSSGSYDY